MSPDVGKNSPESAAGQLNFKETELTLGLPGEGRIEKSGKKRGFSDTVEFSLGRCCSGGGDHRICDENESHNEISSGGKPPSKAKVVGWPPIRACMKKTMTSCKYVKVAVDGAPYLRKVNLESYSTYHQLLYSLENMFSCLIISNILIEKKLIDPANGTQYVPTYEDKDGDWMLVGDVPWKMFVESCKRLRLMKSSEAIGLGLGNRFSYCRHECQHVRGYDPREDLAYEVCRHSLLKRSSIPIEIHPIKQSELREKGLYWRERGKLESTEFSFSRFLTPHLANYDGWAMFVDCDFLYLADIKELTDLIEDKYAIMCVQHDYTPKETTKMDGVVQTVYPRKNWSSMVLYNCGHPKNRVLTPEVVNTQTGAYLHRFQWLEDNEIGEISFVWNFLVGHNKVVEGDPKTSPKAIHYTLGGPWFEAWKDCQFADLWLNEMEEYKKAAEKKAE